ncbi:MAG: TIGR03089 family protein, partial [Actinomycetota bacterium]|nr:TIGR03089 family protein [Actinomycetota bacterium]
MLRRDATRPRLTFYDDADGPTRGERIELSAKVLANWVAKGANLLQD